MSNGPKLLHLILEILQTSLLSGRSNASADHKPRVTGNTSVITCSGQFGQLFSLINDALIGQGMENKMEGTEELLPLEVYDEHNLITQRL